MYPLATTSRCSWTQKKGFDEQKQTLQFFFILFQKGKKISLFAISKFSTNPHSFFFSPPLPCPKWGKQ